MKDDFRISVIYINNLGGVAQKAKQEMIYADQS